VPYSGIEAPGGALHAIEPRQIKHVAIVSKPRVWLCRRVSAPCRNRTRRKIALAAK
jgi:hypothetical protein